jgi:hypothetical protein
MLSDLGNFSEDEAYHISKIISEPTAIVYDVKRSPAKKHHKAQPSCCMQYKI